MVVGVVWWVWVVYQSVCGRVRRGLGNVRQLWGGGSYEEVGSGAGSAVKDDWGRLVVIGMGGPRE